MAVRGVLVRLLLGAWLAAAGLGAGGAFGAAGASAAANAAGTANAAAAGNAAGAIAQAGNGREEHRFYGYAFDQDSGRYLYTEVHHHVYQGARWVGGTIRYYDAGGALIGEKTLDFSQDPYVPVFQLRLPREGYEEGISAVAKGGIDIDNQRNGKHEHVRLERAPEMVADSGFHCFVVQHLDELERGQTVKMDFIAVGRLHDYRFRIVKVGDTTVDGHPAVQLRAEPDSLLRLLVPPILMTYDLTTRYLSEYHGLSNLHDPATGKSWMVRLVYPAHPPAGAPASLPPLEGSEAMDTVAPSGSH